MFLKRANHFLHCAHLSAPHLDLGLQWLLLVLTSLGLSLSSATAQNNIAKFRAIILPEIPISDPGFTSLPSSFTQIDFANQLQASHLAQNQILEVGSGVALGDVNGDALPDIYLCSLSGGNRLFLNHGNWKFEDATRQAGVACDGQFSTGAALADIDGDSDLDLLVNAIGRGTRIFLNNGSARFTELPSSRPVSSEGATSMALADYDNDGDLDLYVTLYHFKTIKDSPQDLNIEAGYVNGNFVIKPPGLFLPLFLKSGGINLFERGQTDFLYQNQGSGNFVPVSWTDGTFLDPSGVPLAEAPRDWGLAVTFRDLTGDRAPDLYICNDFFHSPDHVWMNRRDGTFQALSPLAIRHTALSSMAMDVADIDRNGFDDILVVDMMSRLHERRHRHRSSLIHLEVEIPYENPNERPEYQRNMLYLNRGDQTYAEIAQMSGLEASEWSWGVLFLDVDLDGYEDVLVTNGNVREANDADLARLAAGRMNDPKSVTPKNTRFPKLETANLAFRNQHDLTFQECGEIWGFNHIGVSHGMALGDLDSDGDLDVVVNHLDHPAGIYRNDSAAPRVAVRLKGLPPNTQGIGSRIELHQENFPVQAQEMMAGGRYLSSDDTIRVFAADPSSPSMTLKIHWRSGKSSSIPNVKANYLYIIEEPNTSPPQPSSPVPVPNATSKPIFENISSLLKQPHQQTSDQDDETQPLLPRKFNRPGPGVAWRDLDGDGWEDLLIGGATGNSLIVYLNRRSESFYPTRRKESLSSDQTAILTYTSSSGDLSILSGTLGRSTPISSPGEVLIYDLAQGTETRLFQADGAGIGPLALGTIAQKMALFVGGRLLPGRYPEAVASGIYSHENGQWLLETAHTPALSTIQRATAAIWADLDRDGVQELLVACDWGPIRIYNFQTGVARERSQEWGLANETGWWNGLACGDFNNDGLLDLVATNWGQNTRYQRHRSHPIRLYYGDWQKHQQIELLEGYFDPIQNDYVAFATLDNLRNAYPLLAQPFNQFSQYSRSSLATIVGLPPDTLRYLEVNTLESCLFINNGSFFRKTLLPQEAQMAPAFGASVGDCDGDGNEDLFISQNFFDLDPEISRYDSGRGLWLMGDGTGHLNAISSEQSGVDLAGQQRGTSLCDFNQDGRIDLAVGVNHETPGLFLNRQAKKGLRIRLKGPRWNPDGIGAMLRLHSETSQGPLRCIQAGSGYFSQESLIQVMNLNSTPQKLLVQWSDGKVTERSIQAGETELTVSYDSSTD